MELSSTDPLLQREQRFHDAAFSDDRRRSIRDFYRLARASRAHYLDKLMRPEHRRVLEWGCGPQSSATQLAQNGATVTAIDISPVAIECARRRARSANVELDLEVMDAHAMDFPDDSFDLVCGQGILHHLRLEDAYREIARVLRPTGRAVFFEPLGHNPALNLIRRATPGMRTPDEHPLLRRDLVLASRFFSHVAPSFFHLSGLALAPLRRSPWLSRLTPAADTLDRGIFALFPPLRWWSWIAVLEFAAPR